MLRHIRYGVRKLYAAIALISVEILVLLVVFSLALIAFISIARMVFSYQRHEFDDHVFHFLSTNVNDVNTTVMQFFTFLGTHTFLIPANILLVCYCLFIRRHKWYSIKVPVVALSSLLLMTLLKLIFQRDRPLTPLLQAAKGFSFPSGHALMSITFYGLLIYMVWRSIKNKTLKWAMMIALFLLIISIGLSRVYLRVHYASDVLAGFCVGILWLIMSLWILMKIEKYSGRKVDPIVQTKNPEVVHGP